MIKTLKIFIALIIFLPNLSNAQEKTKKEEKTNRTKVDAWSGATQYGSYKQQVKGNISGKIIHEKTKKPLEFATISLFNKKNEKLVEGTITNEKGKFVFNNVIIGEYQIDVSYIGFKNKTIDIQTSKSKPDLKLNKIILSLDTEMLSEVKIEDEKLLYENRIDKIVYNAENDLNETENDATDVLRKAPLLSVDLEGNVSLRGSRNIKFLVNGKASTFFSSDIATALQMIPAEEIKSIEVITSPGAKYDGEGDAGIVNIITKKSIIDGYKGTINGSIGSKSNRVGLNLSLGKGKFGLSARGGIHGTGIAKREGTETYQRLDWNENLDTNQLYRNGISENYYNGYRGSINTYYEMNNLNTLNSSLSFNGRTRPSIKKDTSEYVSFDGNKEIEIDSVNKTDRTLNVEWTTDYTKKFNTDSERELSIAFQIGGDINDGDTYINNNGTITNNQNDEKVVEETFQIDYIHPFGKTKKKKSRKQMYEEMKNNFGRGRGKQKDTTPKNKIEIGAKIINRDREIIYSEMQSNRYIMNEQFDYQQLVSSSYISAQMNLPLQIGLKSGLRYENTQIQGNWKNNSQGFNNGYGDILPSIVLSKSFSPMRSAKLSYNKRITRPSVKQINSNSNRTDNMNVLVGNPNLEPTETNQYEFSINSFGKIIQGSWQLYHKNSVDVIESFLEVDSNGVSISKYQNIGESKQNGCSFFGSINLNKFNLRSSIDIYNYSARDPELGYANWTKPVLLYSYWISGNYNLTKYWKAETFAFFRSPTQTIQGSIPSWSMMSIGVKKVFKNQRGSLGIRVIEPFNKNKEFISNLNGEFFSQSSIRSMPFRSFTISFKYTIGKLNFKEGNKKTNIKNDDIQKDTNNEYQ